MAEEKSLMSEFRKLQTETTGIRSLFSDKSLDVAGLTGNKLAKDFCERITELHDQFNKEVLNELKIQVNYILTKILDVELVVEAMRKEVNEETGKMKQMIEESNKKVLEELQKIRVEVKEKKFKIEEAKVLEEEKTDKVVETSKFEKIVVMKQVFKNVKHMEPNAELSGEQEEHFNIPWKMKVARGDEYFHSFLSLDGATTDRTVNVKHQVKMTVCDREFKKIGYEKTTLYGTNLFRFTDFKTLRDKYLAENEDVTVEVVLQLTKINGFYGKNLRKFDEKQVFDFKLIVEGTDFHVFKLFLSSQSEFFKRLFDEDPGNKEFVLDDVETTDFQVFLEIIYCEPALDDATAEILLHLSAQFEVPTITKRCEEFLIKSSEKPLKKKLQMATKYGLEDLKKSCLKKVNSAERIRSILPSDLNDLDPLIMTALLEKSLKLVDK